MVRGQITVRRLRTSLRGRRERRGEIEGGGEGVWGRRIGVGGVGIKGVGGERGIYPRTILVLLVGRELVRGEGGRMMVSRANGMNAVGCGMGLGEPGGVFGVEGGKRGTTRVGEMMMILERMDWR